MLYDKSIDRNDLNVFKMEQLIIFISETMQFCV